MYAVFPSDWILYGQFAKTANTSNLWRRTLYQNAALDLSHSLHHSVIRDDVHSRLPTWLQRTASYTMQSQFTNSIIVWFSFGCFYRVYRFYTTFPTDKRQHIKDYIWNVSIRCQRIRYFLRFDYFDSMIEFSCPPHHAYTLWAMHASERNVERGVR